MAVAVVQGWAEQLLQPVCQRAARARRVPGSTVTI